MQLGARLRLTKRVGCYGLGVDSLSVERNSRPPLGSDHVPRVPLRSTLGYQNPQLRCQCKMTNLRFEI